VAEASADSMAAAMVLDGTRLGRLRKNGFKLQRLD